MCPKNSRRSAPGFHQKQSTRPQIVRRCAPEPCRWCEKAPNFPALHIVAPPLNETSLALNHGFGRCARPWHGKSVSLHAELVCQRLHVKAI